VTLGLSQQQWVLLAAIARGGREGIPLSTLGRNLLVTKANITGMVDRLERLGYVAREAHPSDRRVTRARLTPRGQRFLAEVSPLQDAWNARAFRAFRRAEKASLLALLEKHAQSIRETEIPAR
jgi:MarR family 2-MHQ and catechol resistance regulon transcriptional repressor